MGCTEGQGRRATEPLLTETTQERLPTITFAQIPPHAFWWTRRLVLLPQDTTTGRSAHRVDQRVGPPRNTTVREGRATSNRRGPSARNCSASAERMRTNARHQASTHIQGDTNAQLSAARSHPHRPLTCADEAPAVAHSTRAHSREGRGKAPQRPTTQPNTHAHPADPRTRGEGAGADARSHCSAGSARIKYPPGNYPVLSRRGRIATLPAAAQKGQRGSLCNKRHSLGGVG